MPLLTGFALLTMQSVVAGVTEEAAFRGYMQSMVARRHGVVLAILAQGTLFGLLHAPNHPGAVLLMLPYYVAVSAVYGGLTWAADSILPALVLHVAGDTADRRPEWQLGTAPPVLVQQSGVDAAFVAAGIAAAALVAATVVSYLRVRMSRRTVVDRARRLGGPARSRTWRHSAMGAIAARSGHRSGIPSLNTSELRGRHRGPCALHS
jgi:uncharacterized membrane protein